MDLDPAEARAIAKDAYIYGFPLVDHYRVQHSYFIDSTHAEYRGPWNQVHNTRHVYTPADTAIHTPNSDTPYSTLGADLRAEPLVLTMPPMPDSRYWSAQFVDAYTHNFAYVGSRTTGNAGGTYLLAGPDWHGEVPADVDAVIRSETTLAFVFYRTQLLGPDDLDAVAEIQNGYLAEPLSAHLGTPPPAAPPAIEFPPPLSAEDERSSLRFFTLVNSLLTLCPTHPSEQDLMARFTRLGIGAGLPFDPAALSDEIRSAVEAGVQDAWQAYEELKAQMARGERNTTEVFGTREHLAGDHLSRMYGAVGGIYGNSKEETLYPAYLLDADGNRPDGATGRYRLRFPPGQLPPVNAFWSLTIYSLPNRWLAANPLDRYLINSPMLPNLVRDPDGGITLHIQHDSPGAHVENNWLPAPAGPFLVALRLYWPQPAAYDGSWGKPPLLRVADATALPDG